jgi:FMN reductase
MGKPVLAGLGGSLRSGSRSAAALRAALRIAEAEGAETEMLDLRDLALPVYSPDLDATEYPAAARPGIERLVAAVKRCDAMLWASPTYHGTVSGAFKNALDFFELVAGDSSPYLEGRAVGLVTIPDRATFGAMADAAHELRAWLAPTRVALTSRDYAPDLSISDAKAVGRLTRLVAELLSFARSRRGA